LGLKHPHDSGGSGVIGNINTDTIANSVMSYRSYVNQTPGSNLNQSFYPTTPMLHDIAAIQYLYGANMNTRKDNTVYQWAPGQQILETIWDAGGTDTINWSNQSKSALINLNAGEWSQLGPGYTIWRTDGSSFIENRTLAIAYGVTIENAIGGSGNDTIIGNRAPNSLSGYSGNDSLYGEEGNDILYGEAGNDWLFGDLGLGVAYIGVYNYGNDTLYGGSGSDYLNGGEGHDYLYGGTEYDLLVGYLGNDTLKGEDGNDIVDGGDGNDNLFGGWNDDTLYGGKGDDLLYGGTYGDILYGGEGNDSLIGFDSQSSWIEWDTFYGGAGSDTFVLGDSSKVFYATTSNAYSDGWVLIKDWDYTSDYIQVYGSSNQYKLQSNNWYGTYALDMGIFYGNNLIGIVEDSTNINFARDFNFV
jgi:Ca2+-binding RTX toxin-like protein